MLTLIDEDAILAAERNVEVFEPLCNMLDVQRQRIRDSYSSLLSEDDWTVIQRDYCQLHCLEETIRALQGLHGCYKKDLSILQREIYGLYAQIRSRDRLESKQVYANVDRLAVSQVIQSHAFILLTMSILPGSPTVSS